MKFKIGDKLLCIKTNSSYYLTEGKKYKIIGFNGNGNPLFRADSNGFPTDACYGEWKFKGKIYYGNITTHWKLKEKRIGDYNSGIIMKEEYYV